MEIHGLVPIPEVMSSFYFSNIPENLQYFDLRRELRYVEFCRMYLFHKIDIQEDNWFFSVHTNVWDVEN